MRCWTRRAIADLKKRGTDSSALFNLSRKNSPPQESIPLQDLTLSSTSTAPDSSNPVSLPAPPKTNSL